MIIVLLLMIPLLLTVCSFFSLLIMWIVLKLTDDPETIKGIIKDIFRDEFDDGVSWTNGIIYYIFSPFILVLLLVVLIGIGISLPVKLLFKKIFDL